MQVNPFNTDIIMPTHHAETGWRKRVNSVCPVTTSIPLLEVDKCRLTRLILMSPCQDILQILAGGKELTLSMLMSSHTYNTHHQGSINTG